MESVRAGRVREVARVFLRLGVIAFGGPAAHTAMMRDELVRRRGWVTDERAGQGALAAPLFDDPTGGQLALMAGVSYQLARAAIVDPLTAAITGVTLLPLWRTKLNSAWYIAAGAAVGLTHALLT